MIRRLFAALGLSLLLFGSAAAFADDETPEQERGTAFQPVTGAQREHVKGGTLLVVAYAVVWCTVFGYVAAQWRRQSRVRDELARMERALEEEKKSG